METIKESHSQSKCREQLTGMCPVAADTPAAHILTPTACKGVERLSKSQKARKSGVGVCLLDMTGQLHPWTLNNKTALTRPKQFQCLPDIPTWVGEISSRATSD